ncbi:hypothetical protein MKZ38_000202 [Zalerion maritima]|uniref:Uncharacterized protein n=1 Tax=Zalerion maritima TaxID=339359 RepID=A0AAD5RRR9_9PEZI|nr:hypothetical protein MKZ38_000202 [Zalerion maritima]
MSVRGFPRSLSVLPTLVLASHPFSVAAAMWYGFPYPDLDHHSLPYEQKSGASQHFEISQRGRMGGQHGASLHLNGRPEGDKQEGKGRGGERLPLRRFSYHGLTELGYCNWQHHLPSMRQADQHGQLRRSRFGAGALLDCSTALRTLGWEVRRRNFRNGLQLKGFLKWDMANTVPLPSSLDVPAGRQREISFWGGFEKLVRKVLINPSDPGGAPPPTVTANGNMVVLGPDTRLYWSTSIGYEQGTRCKPLRSMQDMVPNGADELPQAHR